MNKIIFLDIDGVLNSQNTFRDNHEYGKFFIKNMNGSVDDEIIHIMLDIDLDKVFILRDICNLTGAKVVVSSSWRRLMVYSLLEEKLTSLGIPIVGTTPYINGNRGDEIREYLEDNKVADFVILDDDIFKDFNELENYLVKTSFYEDGLNDEISKEVVRILRKNNKKTKKKYDNC